MRKLFGRIILVAILVLGIFAIIGPAQTSSPEIKTPKTSIASSKPVTNQPKENRVVGHSPQSSPNNPVTTSRPLALQNKQPKTEIIENGIVYPNRVYATLMTPNDPSYSQWWVAPNGMNEVWDIPAGTYQTKVAVIDTGFALSHQEFTGRWAVNSGESGPSSSEGPSDKNCTDQSLALDKSCNNIDDNFDQIVDNETGATTEQNPSDLNCTDQSLALDKSCNNLDDDSNGYKDDVTGWDFVNFDSSVQAGQINPTGSGTVHGTMVAGVLGASGNNGVGIAGVNWHTKILPIQALDDNGYGDSFTVGQAVYYAVNQGADIISISLGTSTDDPYMRNAILYALDHGALVVSATGNNGCDCISYPANYPEVVAVGAINSSGNLASFSNYGAQLDILAPGQTIATTTYSSTNQTSAYSSSVAGTSFATPFVSGLLALGKMSQPTASWEEIIGTMFENSDRRTLTAAIPRTNTLGFGVVRSNTMLARLRGPTAFAQRVQFDDLNLGSRRNYQCDESAIPATRLYELTKSGQYKYTSNLRELSKSAQTGWTSSQVGYNCMGLPTDTIDTLRVLNLPAELHNIFVKN